MNAKTFLRNYQTAAVANCFTREGTDVLSHLALGLTGEAGEVADVVKKSQYDPPREIDVPNLINELGDTLFYLTCIAAYYGYDLQEVAVMNAEKLADRHPEGPFVGLMEEVGR